MITRQLLIRIYWFMGRTDDTPRGWHVTGLWAVVWSRSANPLVPFRPISSRWGTWDVRCSPGGRDKAAKNPYYGHCQPLPSHLSPSNETASHRWVGSNSKSEASFRSWRDSTQSSSRCWHTSGLVGAWKETRHIDKVYLNIWRLICTKKFLLPLSLSWEQE